MVLPLSDFNVRSAAADGRQARCRACCRRWYEAHRTAHIRNVYHRNSQFRKKLYEMLGEYLITHPCVDCGERDIRCLEFDHRDPTLKVTEVTRLIANSRNWAVVMQEIDKCDVRCANCHRRRTAAQATPGATNCNSG